MHDHVVHLSCIASSSIRKLPYIVLLPAYKHSGNIVIHSTTVVTLLHACKWLLYRNFVPVGSNATTVAECVQGEYRTIRPTVLYYR